jgi:hypothetical protein
MQRLLVKTIGIRTRKHDKRAFFQERDLTGGRPIVGFLVVVEGGFTDDPDQCGDADITIGRLVGCWSRHSWFRWMLILEWDVGWFFGERERQFIYQKGGLGYLSRHTDLIW